MRAVLVLLALAAPAPGLASPPTPMPPALRRSAMLCLGEALRLCPDALAADDHGLSCILGKRRLLGASCRGVYDQGVRMLGGRAVPHVARPPRTP